VPVADQAQNGQDNENSQLEEAIHGAHPETGLAKVFVAAETQSNELAAFSALTGR
jgi:hypothetical protein